LSTGIDSAQSYGHSGTCKEVRKKSNKTNNNRFSNIRIVQF